MSAVDFYNPAPLIPVPAEKSAQSWAAIRDVERFHWATNHASRDRMRQLSSDASYLGPITAESIDLFYKHRGCAACQMGRMKHHSQHASTRGMSEVVGHTIQGDFFFIEGGRHKIPVLLLVDEATLFTYMFAFTGDGPHAQGRTMCTQRQFKTAIIAMLGVWRRAVVLDGPAE